MIFLATIYNCVFVFLAVWVHYEFLYFMSNKLAISDIKPRLRVVGCVFGILVIHTAQVWLFALAYYICIQPYWDERFGDLFDAVSGEQLSAFLDCLYFSFTSFTTLGFGDIAPTGIVRFLTGVESLAGFVLITWSASFLFFEMDKDWER